MVLEQEQVDQRIPIVHEILVWYLMGGNKAEFSQHLF